MYNHHDFGRQGIGDGLQLSQLILYRTHQRFDFQRQFTKFRLIKGSNLDLEKWLLPQILFNASLGQPLHQNLDPAVIKLDHTHDHRHGANPIDIVLVGLFFTEGFLRRQKDQAALFHGLFHRLQRSRAANKKGQNHMRKDHRITHRQQRQLLGHFKILHRHFPIVLQKSLKLLSVIIGEIFRAVKSRRTDTEPRSIP